MDKYEDPLFYMNLKEDREIADWLKEGDTEEKKRQSYQEKNRMTLDELQKKYTAAVSKIASNSGIDLNSKEMMKKELENWLRQSDSNEEDKNEVNDEENNSEDIDEEEINEDIDEDGDVVKDEEGGGGTQDDPFAKYKPMRFPDIIPGTDMSHFDINPQRRLFRREKTLRETLNKEKSMLRQAIELIKTESTKVGPDEENDADFEDDEEDLHEEERQKRMDYIEEKLRKLATEELGCAQSADELFPEESSSQDESDVPSDLSETRYPTSKLGKTRIALLSESEQNSD